MANLTEKNTKKELLDAYNQVKSKLETEAGKKFDPAKEVEKKKQDVAVSEVRYNLDSIGLSLEQTRESLEETFDNLRDKLFEGQKMFENLEESINTKEIEIKDLFGIEKEAYSLVALVQSQDEIKAKFLAEKQELEKLWNDKIYDVTKNFNEESAKLKKEFVEFKKDEDEKRRREREEYNYTFDKEKKISDDKFNDHITLKRKEFETYLEEETKNIDKQKEDLEKREATLKDMEDKIANFDTVLKNAVTKEVAIVTNSLKKDHTHAIELLNGDLQAKTALYESRIAGLHVDAKRITTHNEELSAKLESAYNKLSELAGKTVEGATNNKIISTLEGALKDKSNNENVRGK